MGILLTIRDKAIVVRFSDQKDSVLFPRKQTPDPKDIRYNDGVKDFAMTIVEKQGTVEGEKYTIMLVATPEDKTMKQSMYYCVKEK